MEILVKLCMVYYGAIASNVSRMHVDNNRYSSDGSEDKTEDENNRKNCKKVWLS